MALAAVASVRLHHRPIWPPSPRGTKLPAG